MPSWRAARARFGPAVVFWSSQLSLASLRVERGPTSRAGPRRDVVGAVRVRPRGRRRREHRLRHQEEPRLCEPSFLSPQTPLFSFSPAASFAAQAHFWSSCRRTQRAPCLFCIPATQFIAGIVFGTAYIYGAAQARSPSAPPRRTARRSACPRTHSFHLSPPRAALRRNAADRPARSRRRLRLPEPFASPKTPLRVRARRVRQVERGHVELGNQICMAASALMGASMGRRALKTGKARRLTTVRPRLAPALALPRCSPRPRLCPRGAGAGGRGRKHPQR